VWARAHLAAHVSVCVGVRVIACDRVFSCSLRAGKVKQHLLEAHALVRERCKQALLDEVTRTGLVTAAASPYAAGVGLAGVSLVGPHKAARDASARGSTPVVWGDADGGGDEDADGLASASRGRAGPVKRARRGDGSDGLPTGTAGRPGAGAGDTDCGLPVPDDGPQEGAEDAFHPIEGACCKLRVSNRHVLRGS
jgi:hypothetical protein